MRLLTFSVSGVDRLGIADGDTIIDLANADDVLAIQRGYKPLGGALSSMRSLLEAGARGRERVAEAAEFVKEQIGADSADGRRCLVSQPFEWQPPVRDPHKILGIGLNYRSHTEEQSAKVPKNPILFAKFASSLIGNGADITVPPGASAKLDYEGELAVVIGRKASGVKESEALSFVAGYTLCNDITARDLQFSDRQWLRSKALDRSTPLGPFLTTADEIQDPNALDLSLTLNGTEMQRASTGEMLFGVEELVSFISRSMTLFPGDVIATGTPEGVGFARSPEVYLVEGDEVEVRIPELGVLRNRVGRDRGAADHSTDPEWDHPHGR